MKAEMVAAALSDEIHHTTVSCIYYGIVHVLYLLLVQLDGVSHCMEQARVISQ